MKSTIRSMSRLFLFITFAVLSASSVLAQAVPDNAPISDQKPGSVLIYNYYGSSGSSAIDHATENTRISLTNTHLQQAGMMSLFFIDPVGGVLDVYICLAPNQTGSWVMSDVDPGVKGYIVAVSVDATGRPNKFNYFTGSEYIKMASGYTATVNAEAISALVDSPTVGANGPLENGVAATLKFDGLRYNKVPSALALDYIPAIGDGSKTMVIVNQIGGSLFNGAKPDDLGGMTGTVYDLATKAFFWQATINSCQLRKVIANDFPQTSPNMSTVIQPGLYGWMKFWPHGANKGVTGMVLYLNTSTHAPSDSRYNGGRNLHHMRQTTDELTIPIIQPAC
ncbi:MAG: hypothetical protein ACKVZH_12180 [Blastocatellia bacterium]